MPAFWKRRASDLEALRLTDEERAALRAWMGATADPTIDAIWEWVGRNPDTGCTPPDGPLRGQRLVRVLLEQAQREQEGIAGPESRPRFRTFIERHWLEGATVLILLALSAAAARVVLAYRDCAVPGLGPQIIAVRAIDLGATITADDVVTVPLPSVADGATRNADVIGRKAARRLRAGIAITATMLTPAVAKTREMGQAAASREERQRSARCPERNQKGFVPQVGYREAQGSIRYEVYPEGLLRTVRPFVHAQYFVDRDGDLVNRSMIPGVFFGGTRNLAGELDLNFDRVSTQGVELPRSNLSYFLQFDPGRRVPRLGLQGFVGEDIDIDNVRVGRGGSLRGNATIRPDPHLTFDVNSAIRWLNVDAGGLFTAQVQRVKATLSPTARIFVRLIGQYVTTRRDPTLYTFAIDDRSSAFSGSALFSYRLNWQTALFVGYGDERALADSDKLERTERQFFVKMAYAIRR